MFCTNALTHESPVSCRISINIGITARPTVCVHSWFINVLPTEGIGKDTDNDDTRRIRNGTVNKEKNLGGIDLMTFQDIKIQGINESDNNDIKSVNRDSGSGNV